MHRISKGTTLVFIKTVDIFWILEFFDKKFQKLSKKKKQLPKNAI